MSKNSFTITPEQKKTLIDTLKHELHNAKTGLMYHEKQLPEAEAGFKILKKKWEQGKNFPNEVKGWIEDDKKEIERLKLSLEALGVKTNGR